MNSTVVMLQVFYEHPVATTVLLVAFLGTIISSWYKIILLAIFMHLPIIVVMFLIPEYAFAVERIHATYWYIVQVLVLIVMSLILITKCDLKKI